MARLICYVHVHKDGESHAFGPSDDVPAWARELITNPDVWDDTTEDMPAGSGDDAAAQRPVDNDPDGPPPKSGQGASRARWAEYAAANDVEVPPDAKREDIISACEKAQVAVD